MSRFEDVMFLHNEKCPECGTRGYLVLPGRGDCQTCLKLRVEAFERSMPQRGPQSPALDKRGGEEGTK